MRTVPRAGSKRADEFPAKPCERIEKHHFSTAAIERSAAPLVESGRRR
jgi:hypothetical protein